MLPWLTVVFMTVTLFANLTCFYIADHSLEKVCAADVTSADNCNGIEWPSPAITGVKSPEYFVMAVGLTLTAVFSWVTNLYLFFALNDRIRTFKNTFKTLCRGDNAQQAGIAHQLSYSLSLGCDVGVCTCLINLCSPLRFAWPAPQLHAANKIQGGFGSLAVVALAVAGWLDVANHIWVHGIAKASFVGMNMLQNLMLVKHVHI